MRRTRRHELAERHRRLHPGLVGHAVRHPEEPGFAAGAPRRPLMLRKVAVTTVVAAVIWLGIYVVVSEPWFSFRGS